MTLLVTVLAAVISTVVWYSTAPDNRLKLGTLCLMYWGAALMWLVDSLTEYFALKAQYFMPSGKSMLNDLFLGLSVVTLGLVVWLGLLLIKDPNGIIKSALLKKQ